MIVVIDPGGDGWWCTCPACRSGEPSPTEAAKALARAVTVTVTPTTPGQWEAWTDPDARYTVAYEPGKPGGWCKHIMAVAFLEQVALRQAALGCARLLEEVTTLKREDKKLRKEIVKWQKKCMG